MQVDQIPDAQTFLDQTRALRAAEPLLTNMLTTVTQGVLSGRYDSAELFVVRQSGRVVGAAVRTPPWPLICSPMPREAARALGAALVQPPDGISGPDDVVTELLAALGRPARMTMRDTVRVLGDYRRPPSVPGEARRASAADLDLLVDWHRAFARDAGLPDHDPTGSVLGRLEHAGLWLWELDGAPVAICGHAAIADGVARIGPVYVPDRVRGRGFGAAVTAAVVEDLLARASTVMLYADAANPTSNRVYERMGFAQVASVLEVELVPEIDTVVFDLGGVLIDWDPHLLYRTFGLSDDAITAILAEIDFYGWNHTLDAGADLTDAVADLCEQFPQHRELIEAFPARFPETLRGQIDGTVELLDALAGRGEVRLLALTNWSAQTFAHARERFAFLQRFESILVSGEERIAKPDPAVFSLLIERNSLDPARTLFIDDAPANVAAAAARGLRAVRFQDPEQLRAELMLLRLI